QVQLLDDFMDKLGITKAALVGHSLGAAVCLRYATLHPDKAPRLALISTPLFDMGGLDEPVPAAVPAPAAAAATIPPAAPITVTPAAPATTTPAAAPATPGSSATPAATPSEPVNGSTDTIPRNPFKGLGDSPEEILARLQAKNVVSSAG